MDMQPGGLGTCSFCLELCRPGFLEPRGKGAGLRDHCLLLAVWEGTGGAPAPSLTTLDGVGEGGPFSIENSGSQGGVRIGLLPDLACVYLEVRPVCRGSERERLYLLVNEEPRPGTPKWPSFPPVQPFLVCRCMWGWVF